MEDIKRGYPDPDYTIEDIDGKLDIQIDEQVIISPAKFEELCSKATALDILKASLQRGGKVNEDIAWAVTGANPDRDVEEVRKDKEMWWNNYWKEKEQKEQLEKKVVGLEKQIADLKNMIEYLKTGAEVNE